MNILVTGTQCRILRACRSGNLRGTAENAAFGVFRKI